MEMCFEHSEELYTYFMEEKTKIREETRKCCHMQTTHTRNKQLHLATQQNNWVKVLGF